VTMNVRVLQPGDEEALRGFLESRPDTTMFLRGNLAAAGLVDRGERFQGTYAAAWEGPAVVAVAALFWNGTLIVEAPRDLEAVVREAVRCAPRGVRGMLGVHAFVEEARAVLGLEGAPAASDSREILYGLDLGALVVPAALHGGEVRCRRAQLADLETLIPWGRAYRVEAIGLEDGPDLARAVEEAERSGIRGRRIWILESGGEPVATTAFNTQTADCVQVGGVYTPPALRSRGYARAAVAGSLRDARAEGAVRSILFTGEDNPAAQACYARLGFEVIGDYHMLTLKGEHWPFGARP